MLVKTIFFYLHITVDIYYDIYTFPLKTFSHTHTSMHSVRLYSSILFTSSFRCSPLLLTTINCKCSFPLPANFKRLLTHKHILDTDLSASVFSGCGRVLKQNSMERHKYTKEEWRENAQKYVKKSHDWSGSASAVKLLCLQMLKLERNRISSVNLNIWYLLFSPHFVFEWAMLTVYLMAHSHPCEFLQLLAFFSLISRFFLILIYLWILLAIYCSWDIIQLIDFNVATKKSIRISI